MKTMTRSTLSMTLLLSVAALSAQAADASRPDYGPDITIEAAKKAKKAA